MSQVTYKYTGKTPCHVGDKVTLIDGDCETEGKVVNTFAVQMLVNTEYGSKFVFYNDKGLTWRKNDE